MTAAMNDNVAAYRYLVRKCAWRFVGRNGAEFDDLEQEGLIFVWTTLEKGAMPSPEHIQNRMKNWVRYLGRQLPCPYERLLRIDIERTDYGQHLQSEADQLPITE